jgi:hypothetical protein
MLMPDACSLAPSGRQPGRGRPAPNRPARRYMQPRPTPMTNARRARRWRSSPARRAAPPSICSRNSARRNPLSGRNRLRVTPVGTLWRLFGQPLPALDEPTWEDSRRGRRIRGTAPRLMRPSSSSAARASRPSRHRPRCPAARDRARPALRPSHVGRLRPRSRRRLPAAEPLIRALRDPAVRSSVSALGGYDLCCAGSVELLT